MDIKTKLICPLGMEACKRVVGEEIHQCAWLVKLAGQNPQTGEQMDEEGCAMHWMPVLLVETANTNRGQTAALESFRNEMVESGNITNNILLSAAQQKLLQQQ